MKKSELQLGKKIEREHKNTIKFIRNYSKKYNKLPSNNRIFQSIAKDHLKEFPKNYYTELNKMEKRLKTK